MISGFISPKYQDEFILPNHNPKISKKFSRTPLKQKLKEDLGLDILVLINHQFRGLTSFRYGF